MFGVMNGFDDVLVITGEVEEAAALSGRSQLGEDVFACKGHQVIGWVNLENGSKVSKHPRGIVFELEVILCRRGKFVTSAIQSQLTCWSCYKRYNLHIKGEFVLCVKVSVGKLSVYLGVCP